MCVRILRLLRGLDNVCVCADEFEFEYPEPAHSSLQVFSMFSWDVMNVAPPECVVADRRTLTQVSDHARLLCLAPGA